MEPCLEPLVSTLRGQSIFSKPQRAHCSNFSVANCRGLQTHLWSGVRVTRKRSEEEEKDEDNRKVKDEKKQKGKERVRR